VSSVSTEGLDLIRGFEGFRSEPYRDAVGVWTIGYGETAGIGPNTKPWSRSYAEQRLRARVNRDYLKPVLTLAKAVGLELKQNEADALASLAYNVGPGVFEKGRTMGDAIRSKNRARIADAFLLYDHAGGRVLEGLTRRRRRERELFLKGR
jgi:lysozyme